MQNAFKFYVSPRNDLCPNPSPNPNSNPPNSTYNIIRWRLETRETGGGGVPVPVPLLSSTVYWPSWVPSPSPSARGLCACKLHSFGHFGSPNEGDSSSSSSSSSGSYIHLYLRLAWEMSRTPWKTNNCPLFCTDIVLLFGKGRSQK